MNTAVLMRTAAVVFALSAVVRVHAAEQIRIDGSTGVTPLVAVLAKAYEEKAPGVKIQIGKGMGTKARIEALREGKIDIAMASHGLDVESIRKQGMAVHEIAKVAVVFGVNASVPISALDDAQICDIYTLARKNWNELGGPDMAIVPVTRPDSEVDAEVVRHQVGCLAKLRMPETVRVAPKAGEMAKELADTPGAIGMTTMTMVEQSAGRIRPISLRGVAPTAANVKSKAYGLTRDSFLVTPASPSPAVAKFLAFIRSDAGEKVISANGAVPVR